MTTIATRTDPYLACNFFVEIEGIEHAGFIECTGLEVTTEVFEYKEGGVNDYIHKLPVRSSYANITLKWGVTDSTALWAWYQNVIRGQFVRKNLSVVQYNTLQEEVRRWNVREAFPSKWVGPTFNADEAQASISTLELTHHGFELQ